MLFNPLTAEFIFDSILKVRMTRYLAMCSVALAADDELSRRAYFHPRITLCLYLSVLFKDRTFWINTFQAILVNE